MAKRTRAQVYQAALAAGFDPASATVLTAIAGAESGFDDTALGDQGLQTTTWGPSYGLFQIRTLKSATGGGGDRDISRLASSDVEQAKAAYRISQGGKDFTPWTTFTSGTYQQFLPAGSSSTSSAAGAGDGGEGPYPMLGPAWLPWNWAIRVVNKETGQVGSVISKATGLALGGARAIVIEGVFVALGLALVGAGLAVAGRPQSDAVRAWGRRRKQQIGQALVAVAK